MCISTILTHFHTHIIAYIATLLYAVRLCPSLSFSNNHPASLAALATEFASIYSPQCVTSVSFHLILISLLTLLLSFLKRYTSYCFIKIFHTDTASTPSSHLLSFSFPRTFHSGFFFRILSYPVLLVCCTIPFQHIPQFLF